MISTGGFVEYVPTQGPEPVKAYIRECREVGFDIVELSSGFVTIPADDWLRLIEAVVKCGMKAKPEVGIQFGAGGATRAEELEAEGTRDLERCILLAKRFLDAGAYLIMVESEGITENVRTPRMDVPARIAHELGLERVMFEAADPGSLFLVRPAVRTRGQFVCGPQPGRAARMPAGRHLGHCRDMGGW